MKVLVNKANPAIRITAPEIESYKEFYTLPDKDFHHLFKMETWTLVEEESKHTEVWVEGRTIFEQEGGPAIVKTIKEFVEKGKRCEQQAVEDNDQENYIFWQGFQNCAENILREVEEPQTVEPSDATCTTCVFYEDNCPFVRGKFVPYPNRVCKDYTCAAHTDVLQNK